MEEPLLQVLKLSKTYAERGLFRRGGTLVSALRDVTLSVARGRTLAIVGESGAGKSTLARCIVRLEEATSGEVRFCGTCITQLSSRQLRPFRRCMQLVHQSSSMAINPDFRIWEVIAEPLQIQGATSIRKQKSAALEYMQQVGLPPSLSERLPARLSGGQLQRAAIARALVLNSELLLLDEPFAGLDVSIQAQLSNLLLSLQRQRCLTYVLILHDLMMATNLADEIAILYQGEIIEAGTPEDILRRPRQEYTKALLAAAFAPASQADCIGGGL